MAGVADPEVQAALDATRSGLAVLESLSLQPAGPEDAAALVLHAEAFTDQAVHEGDGEEAVVRRRDPAGRDGRRFIGPTPTPTVARWTNVRGW